MIEITNKSLLDFLTWDLEESIEDLLQNRPFVGDFIPCEWNMVCLKIGVHRDLNPYRLFKETVLTSDDIEVKYFISFEDKSDELLFKLKFS